MSGNQWRSPRPNDEEQGRERFNSIDSESSTRTFRSFITTSSNASTASIPYVPLRIPERGEVIPNPDRERDRVMRRIQERANTIEARRMVEEPFSWAAQAGPAVELVRDVVNNYRSAREAREERTRKQEEHDNCRENEKRERSIPRGPKPEKIDTSKIPMRKDKHDNPALRLLEEQKEKDRIKRIKELKKKGTKSFEAPDTPLPPYTPRGYKIPEDLYEELEFKRLKDKMFNGNSDPEVERFRRKPGKVYPTLPQEDYDYICFGGLRRWVSEEPQPKRNVASRKMIPLPPKDSSSDSDSDYQYVSTNSHKVLRLRGGAGSNSGSPVGTPTTGDRKRKQGEGGESGSDQEKEGGKQVKWTKTSNRMSALNDNMPGMDAAQIFDHVKDCREIGKDFSAVLTSEKEKKKISIKSLNDLQGIKIRYQDLVDDLIAENSLLAGRLLEARRSAPTEPTKEKSTAKVPKKTTVSGKKTNLVADKEPVAGCSSANLPKKKASYAEKVRFQDPVTTDTEAVESDNFTVVTRRRKRKKAATSGNVPSGTDSGTDNRSARASAAAKRKAKTEKLKSIEPPKTFTVGVGETAIGEVKKNLWSDLLKKMEAPNIISTRVMPKGDIQVIPADDATYEALKKIASERSDVKQNTRRLPMIMIHDVDVTLTGETLASTLAIQNHALGLSQDEAIAGVKPSFKRGPPNKETVHWVCMVTPEILRKLAGKRVYLGMSCCRITEYYDYNQCYKCLQYGHREKFCVSMFTACSHCAEKGHSGKECPNKEKPSKCINCKKGHEATSPLCGERTKALDSVMRKTAYGIPQ